MNNITITFSDGTNHVYENVPGTVTPDQVQARAQADYPNLGITAIDRAKSVSASAERTATASAPVNKEGMSTLGKIGRTVDDTVRGVADMATFGFADELSAGIGAIGDRLTGLSPSIAESYKQRVQQERALDEQGGAARTVGQVAGAFLQPEQALIKAGAGLKSLMSGSAAPVASKAAEAVAGTVKGTVGSATALGATAGGLYGLGSATEDPLADSFIGAATGGGLGFVLGGATKLLTNKIRSYNIEKLPTLEQVKDSSQAAYKAADDLGIVLKPKSVMVGLDKAEDALKKEGVTRKSPLVHHQDVYKTLDYLKGATKGINSMTWQDLENIRRQATTVARTSPNPEVRRLSGQIVQQLDDHVQQLQPQDFVKGTQATAGEALKLTAQARESWKQARKAETLQDLLTKVETNGEISQRTDAAELRSQLTRLKKSNEWKLFNGTEKAQLESVINRGAVEKTFDVVNGMGFGQGKVATAASAAAAYQTGGASLIGQAALYGVGKGRDIGLVKETEQIARQVASGKTVPQLFTPVGAQGVGMLSGSIGGLGLTEYAREQRLKAVTP